MVEVVKGSFGMIPKIIHYCWLSGEPYPEDVQRCINSWHKYLPEYEYKLWTKDNFNMEINSWVKEAFENNKYAFVSDFIRLYALYEYGGIYLDSDLEVLKPIDKLLNNKAFTCFESDGRIAGWIFGCEKGNKAIKALMNDYNNRHYLSDIDRAALIPNTVSVTRVLSHFGISPEDCVQEADEITVFSSDYFSPFKPWYAEETVTENTFMRHLYCGSWKNATDIEFWNFLKKLPLTIRKVKNSLEPDKKMIIYGFGIAGSVVYRELERLRIKHRIRCFAISKYDTEWRSGHGIEIKEIDDLDNSYRNDVFLLATPPKYHKDIEYKLREKGFLNIERLC